MTQRLTVVHFDGTPVGELTRTAGRITFRYKENWRIAPDATPLSVSMPLTARDHPHRIVEPWLWGLLPDNDGVLRRWGREFATTTTHPMGLLAGVGADLPGAFRILPNDSSSTAILPTDSDPACPPGDETVEWLTDLQIADLLRQVRADHTAWLGANAAGRWSLAGAQPKIALLHQDHRWGRPHGQTPTTHILKPAITGLDGHDLNEHLCLRTARLLGLRAARSTVADFAGERAVVVTRYDRLRTESGLTRIHQEDMCQALGVHPEHKYESDGGPSAAAIAKLLAAHISGRAGESARGAFAAALAFNWLIGAPDAHAKNYGLLLSGRQVRLAPLYDVASALPYGDLYEPKLRLAMRIGRTYEAARMNAAHWQEEAGRLRVDPEWLLSHARNMAEQLPGALAEACADPDIAALASPLPARLLERAKARAGRCADLLN